MSIELWPGRPWPRGASWDGAGVNFSLYSEVATRVEVCLFAVDEPSREVARFDLPENTAHFSYRRVAPTLLRDEPPS